MADPVPDELKPAKAEVIPLAQFEIDLIDSGFSQGRGYLDMDANNLLGEIAYAEIGKFEKIRPLLSYEDYLRKKASFSSSPQKYYEYVMGQSDLAKIRALNAKIDEFNKALPAIQAAKDTNRAMSFQDELSGMIGEKRPDFDDIYKELEASKTAATDRFKKAEIDKWIAAVEAIQVDPAKMWDADLPEAIADKTWSALLDGDRAPMDLKRGVKVDALIGGRREQDWHIYTVHKNQVELLRLHEKDGNPPERATVNKRDIRPDPFVRY